MAKTAKQRLGNAKEAEALDYLVDSGLTPVTAQFRCRLGEIDLIMRDGDTLVFVEVRFRRSQAFGGALASVDSRKQRRLTAAAGFYLTRCDPMPACRFDVIAIGTDGEIQWIRNAFEGAWN